MGFFGSLFGGGASEFNPVIRQAGDLEGTNANMGKSLFGQSQGISGLLSPYYSNMMTNPQGLGATALSQQLTQSGQGISGAGGAARERALDIGARTGNTASIPAAISSANKAGMVQQSNNTNNLALQNAMLKQKQQQQGAEGLSGLFGTDLSGSLKANDNAINALSPELSAIGQKNAAEQKGISNIMGMASGVMGGLGNLDMTGGSSPFEQLMNFAGGV